MLAADARQGLRDSGPHAARDRAARAAASCCRSRARPRFPGKARPGAASYDVERAAAADGPWTTVGKDVSDADYQYRPLFSDDSAAPGQAAYYRVIARNSAGAVRALEHGRPRHARRTARWSTSAATSS